MSVGLLSHQIICRIGGLKKKKKKSSMCESLGDEGQDTIGKDIKQSVPLPAEAP